MDVNARGSLLFLYSSSSPLLFFLHLLRTCHIPAALLPGADGGRPMRRRARPQPVNRSPDATHVRGRHPSQRLPGSWFSVSLPRSTPLWLCMALVRILVDGYSLLHNWPGLAPGRARHSAAAREALVWRLTQYQDATGTPVTVFFDGAGLRGERTSAPDSTLVEVLYSRRGQTADQMIERAMHRFVPYGEVLAVTDDNAERETVISLGGRAASCRNFIRDVENALADLGDDIKTHNRQERHRFQRRK